MKHKCHRMMVKAHGNILEVVTYRRVARGRIARVGTVVCKRSEFRGVLADPKVKSVLGLPE